jgi:alpha-beta hydrolase superfamily lysophospholipase
VNARHPDVPHFLLGESMGGAVVMAALDEGDLPDIDGAILISPAVWGRDAQGPLAAGALWFFAHTVPWLPVSGEGFNVVPSDNVAMLRAMWRDPLVLKESRVDSIYGLTDLMDRSAAAVERLGPVPTFILYGANEDVMPTSVVTHAIERLPKIGDAQLRVAVYSAGYHMLLRDLEAEIVWQDITSWMTDPALPLPSGADLVARRLLSNDDETLEDVAAGAGSSGRGSGGDATNPVPVLARPRG